MSYWSPFDCLAVADITGSGLLQRYDDEVELLVQGSVFELRSGSSADPMVPIASNKTNTIDETKRKTDYIDRESNLQLIITTHRIVFFRTSDNDNNNNNNNKREGRYMHCSNIFNVTTETQYFKSPKIIIISAFGDIILAYTNSNKGAKNERDECYQQIQLSLQRKQWELEQDNDKKKQNEIKKNVQLSHKVGVDAVLSASKYRHEHATKLTNTAFDGDIDTLLKEGKELVKIIHKYVATLDRNSSNNNNNNADNTDQLVSMMQDMGMTSVLDKNQMMNNNDIYYDHTARQIADFIRPKLKINPVITLTDVYCLFNRSRGTHLLSPEDLLLSIEKLHNLQLGISLITFPNSGLKVIQDDTYNDTAMSEKFLKLCNNNNNNNEQNNYITALSVSRQTHVPVVLALEQLHASVRAKYFVCDETLESIRFYPNIYFTDQYTWK